MSRIRSTPPTARRVTSTSPESQSGRYYCVKYVGEGNGDYDLYSQYYNKGAEQPYSHVTAEEGDAHQLAWRQG